VTRAPIPLPGQTVILDYRGVISLTPSPADRDVITRLAGVGPDSEPFWQAYFAHRDGLDQGSAGVAGVAAYWQAIAGDLGASWDGARVISCNARVVIKVANQSAITAVTGPAPGRTRRCCADRLAAMSPAEAAGSGPAPGRRPTSGWCVACARAAALL
jgi:hypothetical protein